MAKGKLTKEIEEMKKFVEFVERTGRLDNIEYIDAHLNKRTPDCIHILKDFSATGTENHEKKAAHLKRLDKAYKHYREHTLKSNCQRCQASLDAIVTFTGYENMSLFSPTIQTILDREFDINHDRSVYLCKLPAPGLNYSELTYITSLPLTKAIQGFMDKIKNPLDLPDFEVHYRKKISNNGAGIPYVQVYLYPKDHRHKTKICIRSRVK